MACGVVVIILFLPAMVRKVIAIAICFCFYAETYLFVWSDWFAWTSYPTKPNENRIQKCWIGSETIL